MSDTYLNSTGLTHLVNKIKTLLNNKANLYSPVFLGAPTAPTASASTDTTQIATTAFVHDAIENDTLSSITSGDTNPVNSVAVIAYINSLDATNVSY